MLMWKLTWHHHHHHLHHHHIQQPSATTTHCDNFFRRPTTYFGDLQLTPSTCNLFQRHSLPMKEPNKTTTNHLQPHVTFSTAQNYKMSTIALFHTFPVRLELWMVVKVRRAGCSVDIHLSNLRLPPLNYHPQLQPPRKKHEMRC
ncbi:hypothetical protein Hanom_Chr12g01167201 [Helianthus anomalus]